MLLGEAATGAWRILRDSNAELYLVYRSVVRQKCGRHITDLLDFHIGPPQARPPRDIVLMSPVELRAQPIPLDTIPRVLPSCGSGALLGAPGSGKSFFGDHLVLSLAADRSPFPGVRHRPVAGVIVGAEGRRIARLAAYAQFTGIDLDTLPVRFIEQAIDLRSPGGDIKRFLDQLACAEQAIGHIGIVLVDTLARTFGGGSENSGEDMGTYLDSLGRIGDRTGGLVLVIHHTGKNVALGARGHSSLLGNLDVQIELTRQDDGLRLAKVTKLRDGQDGVEFAFRLETVDLGPHPDPLADPGERWTSCVCVPAQYTPQAKPKGRRLPAGAQVALDALRLAIENHGERTPKTSVLPKGVRAVRLDPWQEAYAAMRPVPNDLQTPDARKERNSRRMAFKRAQDELQAARAVGTGAGFWWIQ
jgi:hypothetical protein